MSFVKSLGAEIFTHSRLQIHPSVTATLLLCYHFLRYNDCLPKIWSAHEDGDESSLASASEQGKANMIDKLREKNRRILLIYGSESKTALSYATRFAKDLRSKLGLSTLIINPADEDFKSLDQLPSDCLAVFFIATFGEGEPTTNAGSMFSHLEDDSSVFSKDRTLPISYAMFGLGNRTYEHFNGASQRLDVLLEKRGAKRIGPRGEGDDDGNLEADYIGWFEKTIEHIGNQLQVDRSQGVVDSDFTVKELGTEWQVAGKSIFHGELSQAQLDGDVKAAFDDSNPFLSPVSTRALFHDKAGRHAVHVELDISSAPGLRYSTGDHVAVWPMNPDNEVERLLQALELQAKADTVIDIEAVDPDLFQVPIPTPTTYRCALRYYLDISALVSRQAITAFAAFAPSPQLTKALQRYASDEVAYHDEVAQGHLTIADLLLSLSARWTIPFDVVISSLPLLRPRFYSISSSPNYAPGKLSATIVVLKEQVAKRGWKYGLASNYVHALQMKQSDFAPAVDGPRYHIAGPKGKYDGPDGSRVPIHIRSSKFRLPASTSTPVIMIGPGTGVAPFRGFVQERVASTRLAGSTLAESWGPMLLYYGCRDPDLDFLYRNEWPMYQAALPGFSMQTAFSRKDPKKKVYVQDLLWNDRAKLSQLITDKKAFVYICGDAKMAKDVEAVLERSIDEVSGTGAEHMARLKKTGRLALDVW